MDKTEESATAVGLIVDPSACRKVAVDLLGRVAGRFARVEPRRACHDLVTGLLAPLERKDGWWLAEHAGHALPDRMQRLPREVAFDHDGARDDLRAFVRPAAG